MADADAEEEPTTQQEQQPSESANPDVAVRSDAVDSPSLEGAPQAEAPAEPDGSPAVEATHVNDSTDHNPAVDGQADADSPTGSPLEEATSGPNSPGDDPDSANEDSTSPSSAETPGQEEGQMDNGASLHDNPEEDAAEGPDSCSGPALAVQAAADAHVEPEPSGAPPEAPPAEESHTEDPPPSTSPTEAPPPEAPPPEATTADDPGPSQDEAALASEPPGTIAASPGSQPGVGNGSPPAGTAAPVSHTARPVRGTLAKPNRGFHGLFVTRNGRKLTPEELVHSAERLSKADLFGVDMKELLAMYGNAPKSKTAVGKAQISPDEIESMVERLYTTKPKHGMTYKARPTPMKAVFYIENGAHLSRLEPIAPKPAQERTEFMCALYERCKESKVKSQQTLADKYLQPLCKPKVYSGPDGKAKISEIAQKLFAGESTK